MWNYFRRLFSGLGKGVGHIDQTACDPEQQRLKFEQQAVELSRANAELMEQKENLRQSEGHLRRALDELEVRVEERTLELTGSNKELRDSRRNYEELVNTIDGIVWEAAIGKSPYTFISRQVERILGYPVENWLTESGFWQRILHPEDREMLTGPSYLPPSQKRNRQVEYRVIAADGRVVWMKDFVTVIFEEGQPTKLRGIMVDISDRKRVETDLISAQETALKAANVKSDFLANMSHEIRTPLNAVLGMSSLALDTKLTRDQRDYIKTIKSSGNTLLTLINDILDFSKIEAGKMSLEILDFQLGPVMKNVLELVSFDIRKKKLQLVTEIDPAISQGLRGDPGRLTQILMNLLSNAAKFTQDGKIILSVRLLNETENQITLRFEVRDTGIGVSSEDQKKLFDPFSQADSSTSRKYGGTGLGLSICKRLVHLMKGEIGLESREGVGSTFWFSVPLERARNSGLNIGASRAIRRRRPSKGKDSKRILLAEDNVANQKVVLRFLQKLGHRADAVANGQEAVRALDKTQYDLVLMDCQMPEMDGYQAAREIRGRERGCQRARVPILALTAHAMSGDRTKCLASEMDDYLTKPVDFSVLQQTLERWLSAKPLAKVISIGSAKKNGGAAAREKRDSLDHVYLRELEELQVKGQPDIVQELAGIFESSALERLNNMRHSLNEKNFAQLAREAHAFRSTCGSVGARAAAECCRKLEELMRQSNRARHGAMAQLTALENEVVIVKAGLDAFLRRKSARGSEAA